MKRAILILMLFAAATLGMQAQNPGKLGGNTGKLDKAGKLGIPDKSAEEKEAALDTVFTIHDYNADLPTGEDVLKQDVSVKPVKKYHSTHMIGVRYGVNFASAHFTPDVEPGSVLCLNNYSVVYTYYNDLWDMMDNFGTQIMAHLNREGFTAEYIPDTKYVVAEVDFLANFRANVKPFRLFINAGPYAGYRLWNDRENSEWRYYDNRFDYGLIFGGGAGVMFGPFEFHAELNYKWGLSSYFHTFYYSDEYWFFSYPRVYMLSGTLYYKF